MTNEKNCPCCPNHCSIDNLSCGKGKTYFNGNSSKSLKERNEYTEKDDSSMTIDEKAMSKIRKCGHFLHHKDKEVSLDFLSNDEKENLIDILSKCLDNWQ
ncbi:MAG: hypothetical protein ACI33S_05975 [Bacilli bacterium]